jgi:hypothetical protein
MQGLGLITGTPVAGGSEELQILTLKGEVGHVISLASKGLLLIIVTNCVQVAVFPDPSVAVNVLRMVPTLHALRFRT